MPHVGSSSAEDLASSDEIKVFKDEGEEEEDEKRACWTDLTDLKSSLITEGDQEKSSQAFSSKSSSSQSTHQNGQRSESTSNFGKAFESPLGYSPFSYPIPHPPYPNGTLGQMANKMAAAVVGGPHSGSPLPPFMMPNMERFPQPPPAHMGIPPVHIETKAVSISAWMDLDISGIGRNPLYNLSGHGHQYSHSVLSDFTQQLQWHNPAMYHQLQFRGPYSSLPSASSFPGFGRSHLPMPSLSGHSFPHPNFLPSSQSNHLNNNSHSPITNGLSNGHKLVSQLSPTDGSANSHNLLVNGSNNHSPQASSSNSRLHSHNSSLNSSSNIGRNNNNNNDVTIRNKNKCNSNSFNNNGNSNGSNKQDKHSSGQSSDGHSDREHSSNKSHIKKPLNAFMIYMREMRAKVIAESTLKESAAINQILGKRWHNLSRVDQEKYYEKARKERELHMEMHPGWTAKDNYAINGKKKKKKRERNADGERGAMKKCRARYGLDQQNHWCKPCRRKKKCIRYMEAMRAANAGIKIENDDNLGSVGSVEAPTPESKSANESDHDNLNLSSTDLSLSSPPTSEYHHFINSFNNFSSSSAINSPTSAHLHLNGHGNGHLHSSPSLFYSHHNPSVSATSLNSPLGSRMSSLLTPNSPLTSSLSSFCSAQSMVPSLQAAPTPSQSQMPPRNSPFSIEQLARPHCPQNRSSPLSSSSFSSASPSFLNSTSNAKSNGSVPVSVITQLPTPPSSTDSTSGTPAMLSVA